MQPLYMNQNTLFLEPTPHLPIINFPPDPNFNTIFEQSINQYQQYLNQIHQDDSHVSPVISTTVHNQEIDQLYGSFIKRIEDTKLKISQASQIQDQQIRATELRRLIFTKPILQEALDLQILIDNTFPNLHKDEIKDDIEQSKRCFQKVQGISRTYQDQLRSLVDPKQVAEAGSSIDSAWNQIYQSPFYDPCLIKEISELEWFLRAREVLSHERADYEYPYVKYCEDLLIGAIESQSEEIKDSAFFERAEEELVRYQILRQKVKRLQGQIDTEKVSGLLQELKEFGFGFKEEIETLEKNFQQPTAQIHKKDVEQNDDKNSMTQGKLEDFMVSTLRYISRFDETGDPAERSQEEKLRCEVAKNIFLANKELLGRLEIDMTTSHPSDEMQEKLKILDFVEDLIHSLELNPPKFENICEWSQSIQEFKLYSKECQQIKAELCLSKVKFIKVFCETYAKPSTPILFQDLCKLLTEIEGYYLQSFVKNSREDIFEECVKFMKGLIKKVKGRIQAEADFQRENEWKHPNKMIYNFIDISNELVDSETEFHDKKRINELSTDPFHYKGAANLNQKRSAVSHLEEEINSYNPRVKKIRGEEESYQTINQFDGDTRKRDQADQKLPEEGNHQNPQGNEIDFAAIKKKETKKSIQGLRGTMENFEYNDCQVYHFNGDQINEFYIDDGFKLKKKNKDEARTDNKDRVSKRN